MGIFDFSSAATGLDGLVPASGLFFFAWTALTISVGDQPTENVKKIINDFQ
jgi:hypothetical protein